MRPPLIGIPRSAWKRWIEQFPDFAEAVEEADDAAQAYWLNIGRKGVMLGAGFSSNTRVAARQPTNRKAAKISVGTGPPVLSA